MEYEKLQQERWARCCSTAIKNTNFGGYTGVHYPQTSTQKEVYKFERTFQQLLISSLLGVGIDRCIHMQTCMLLNSAWPKFT